MPNLIQYFTAQNLTNKALNRYKRFAIERDWRIGGPNGKLKLYSLGLTAFDSRIPQPEAKAAFSEAYEIVRSWPGIERGGKLANPAVVFETIQLNGGKFVGDGAATLSSLTYPSPESDALEAFLPTLSLVKPTKLYPWMAVSKVLHFCNPSLFPIWDWDLLWNQVMWRDNLARRYAPFRAEYEEFCRSYRFDPTTSEPVFLLTYTLWATSYIQRADHDFMTWFATWLTGNFRNDLICTQVNHQITLLYSTAFEFVAIGAAYLEAGE